ncbi:adenine nucleotide translocase lysine N-methyltransferase-like isoform 4-T4 [Hipposideros larvatus]
MQPPALLCALCCGLLAAAARAGYSEDRCSWRGSGLTQEPGSVGQLALACTEGGIEWLYPAGALRLTLGSPDSGARPRIACLRPVWPFAGAQVFAERAGGSLELLLAEGPGPAGGRCVRWGPREGRALFLQATPHRDISRRVASFRFELREDGHPELPPQAHGLGMDGACRPCSDAEFLLALCTSDFDMEQDDPDEALTELRERRLGALELLQVAAGSGLAAYAVWALILQPGFRRVPLRLQVPYVGASVRQVEHVLSLLRGRSGKLVDLGSGDGRIVLAAHRCGLRPAMGYELNPWLVGLARLHAWRAGCAGCVSYHREDLWKVSLRDCHNVSVFLAPSVLPLLESKLQVELPEGARVVSGRFPLPTWQPVAVVGEGLDRVWAYDIHNGGPAGQAASAPSSTSVPRAPDPQAG